MACIGLLILVILALVPLAQMLLGNGPNGFRKLLRLDIAAFFVITSGFAGALAVARLEQSQGWICVMVWILPMALALAWFLRYVTEDIAINFGKRRDRQDAAPDLAFLNARPAELEETPLDAELIAEPPVRGDPPTDGKPPAPA